METLVFGNRYRIDREIGALGNSILCIGYDTLTEKEVLLTIVVFPVLGSKEKERLCSYYENLINNSGRISCEFLCPITDLYETVFGKISALEKQRLAKSLPDLNLSNDMSVFYFISSKKTEEKVLSEIPFSNKISWEKYFLYSVQALSCLHEHGIFYYNLSPFSILCSEEGISLANAGIVPPGHLFFLPSCYSAPEIREYESHDCRCDLYSLAASFYHWITGKTYNPKREEENSFVDISPEGKEILISCLQPLPKNRFRDAAECVERLSSISGRKEITANPRRFLLDAPFSYNAFIDIEKKLLDFEDSNLYIGGFISASSGMGKTIFLEQIQRLCIKKGYIVFKVSCFFQNAHPLLPFLDILEKLGESAKEETGFSLEPPLYSYFSLEETYQKFRRQIANILFFKASTPFVLLLDDLQWASKETLDIIKYLLLFSNKQDKKSKLRILATYHQEKSGILDRFLEKLRTETIENSVFFSSLEDAQDSKNISSWVAGSLGMKHPPMKFISQVSQITGNHFVYMQTILLTFLQKKILYKEHGEWCIAGNPHDLDFPKTFMEAVQSYLSTLSKESMDFLVFLCLSGISTPLDSLLNYSKANNINGIFLLWQFYRDKIVRIEENLMVSIQSGSFSQHCHKIFVSQKEVLPQRLEKLQNFYKSGILSFYVANFYPESQALRAHYKEIFLRLILLGMEDALEKWLEKYLSVAISENTEDIILIAEMAFYLRMNTIASCYFEKLQKKVHSPLAIARLYEIAVLDENFSMQEKYSKSLEKEEDPVYQILYFKLEGQKNYLKKEEKSAWQSFLKALELCQKSLTESKEKEIFFRLYYEILQNKFLQRRASEIEGFIMFALAMAEAPGKQHCQTKLYNLLGIAYKQGANYKKASENFQKSLELAERFFYPSATLEALLNLCEMYATLGCYKKADSILSQSIHIYKVDRIKGYIIKAALMKARLESLKNKEKAQDMYQEAIQIAKKHQDSESIALSLLGWSEWLISRNLKESIARWQEAKTFLESLLYPYLEIYSGLIHAKLELFSQRDSHSLRDFLKEILALAHEKNHREFLWQIYACYAESYRIEGNVQESLHFFEIAQKTLKENVQLLSEDIQESYLNSLEIKQFFKRMGNMREEFSLAHSSENKNIEDSIMPYQQEVVNLRLNALKEENDHLHKLLEINKSINTERDLRKLLDMIMDTAIEITRAERGFLILSNTKEEQKAFEVARNFEKEDISHPEFEISHSITENAIGTGIPVLATDAMEDIRFDGYRSVSDLKLHSVLVVPLKIREQIIGAVYIDNRFEKAIFSEKEKDLLSAFADQAAIAIQNARLFEENKKKQTELEESKSSIEELNQKLALANAKLAKRIERKEEELKEVKDILQNNQYELESVSHYHNLIGKSKRMQEIFQILEKIADKNIPIFIYGESGTGKELVARAIHFNGNRKEKNFLSENCAAITESLLESELFGHMKGSFTGAYSDQKGLFELADSGTLFLDEIGDMSPNMQAKLLRVLETNRIRRVGGKEEISIDVRIVSASNKSLVELVSKGLFREDLFFRLRVIQIDLPPLRERKEDIPLLIEHFLAEYAREHKTQIKTVDKKTLAFLMNCHWPGNIRELKNTIYNVLSLNDEDVLTISHFKDLNPSTAPKSSDFLSQEMSIDDYARAFVLYNQDKYNDSQLARILGFSRKTLWEKRKKWGILKS